MNSKKQRTGELILDKAYILFAAILEKLNKKDAMNFDEEIKMD